MTEDEIREIGHHMLTISLILIEDVIRQIMDEAKVELDLTNLVCQTHLAIGLAKRLEKEEDENIHPPMFHAFMGVSKVMNMLDYMWLCQRDNDKITQDLLLDTMINHPAASQLIKDGLDPRRVHESSIYLINEALPVLLEFGGVEQTEPNTYKLSKVGQQCAQMWISFQETEGQTVH